MSDFRSIAEPAELSMVAVDRGRDAARDQPRLNESPLTRAAFYGPNASTPLTHLNRDEARLTGKRPDGSTRWGALADSAGERVRKSPNPETAYPHGRFGALPRVDRTDPLRALGLIG
ncbi:hypothetical protein [Actinoplanes sp. G11-F43]|uniref:hypothetical protein n=1 Tax=Actinoplanes sp. G11-F43 TaxID=3424130 RepID=UPI003D330F9B